MRTENEITHLYTQFTTRLRNYWYKRGQEKGTIWPAEPTIQQIVDSYDCFTMPTWAMPDMPATWPLIERVIQYNRLAIRAKLGSGEPELKPKTVVTPCKADRILGSYVLKTAQVQAADQLIELYKEWRADPVNTPCAAYVKMGMGQGKTFVAGEMIRYLDANGLLETVHAMSPVKSMFMTASSVVMQTTDKFKKFKLDTSRHIIVSHGYFSLKSTQALMWSNGHYTHPDPPRLVFIDEGHAYKKPSVYKSKLMKAFAEATGGQTFFVFMSGTPAVVLSDYEMFVTLGRFRDASGEPVSAYSAKAWIADKADVRVRSLSHINHAAIQRFNKATEKYTVLPRKTPSKFKVINKMMLISFKSQAQYDWYLQAQTRWLEQKKRMQEKISTRGQYSAALMAMRGAEETCKVDFFVDRIVDGIKRGKAPLIFVAFQDTLQSIVLKLIFEHGFSRDDIAVIWGGERPIPEDKLLPVDEWIEYLAKITEYDQWIRDSKSLDENFEEPDDPWVDYLYNGKKVNMRQRVNMTKRYIRQQFKLDLTPEEHKERDALIRSVRLFAQNRVERFEENQRYLDGRAKCCIATLSAGGVGIDLDHQNPDSKQREVYLTPCYYGEEIMQALFRTLRIATLSDTEQYTVFLRKTIVAEALMPVLGERLKSITVAASSSSVDFTKLLEDDQTIAAFLAKDHGDYIGGAPTCFDGIVCAGADDVPEMPDDDEDDYE